MEGIFGGDLLSAFKLSSILVAIFVILVMAEIMLKLKTDKNLVVFNFSLQVLNNSHGSHFYHFW